jgi:hypothetical protein
LLFVSVGVEAFIVAKREFCSFDLLFLWCCLLLFDIDSSLFAELCKIEETNEAMMKKKDKAKEEKEKEAI